MLLQSTGGRSNKGRRYGLLELTSRTGLEPCHGLTVEHVWQKRGDADLGLVSCLLL
jgi:hypothetical protein